ncbi:MAG: porin [Rikenellaceae bacterium]
MKKVLAVTLLSALAYLAPMAAKAQNNDTDSLKLKIEELEKKVNTFGTTLKSSIKLTGYIQTQWQLAEEDGALTTFNGGNFPTDEDNRFMVRRGRFKFNYNYQGVTGIIQVDVTEKGINLKDAYLGYTVNSKVFGVTAGVFKRPFGYEVTNSSNKRETPERSRLYQNLFPGSRDVGAKITLQGKEGSFLNAFTFNGGLFNGNGINAETNNAKDFIGRLAYNKTKGAVELGLGTSIYAGQVQNDVSTSYTFNNDTKAYTENTNAVGLYSKRFYWGLDGQFTIKTDAGRTNVRGDYIIGRQPGTSTSSMSTTGAVASSVYNRKFAGYAVYVVQGIKESDFSLAARYDLYDPNREIEASEIGVGSNTGYADVAFKTLSTSFIWDISKTFRVMANYEFVWNEKCANLSNAANGYNYAKDLRDNILTLRLQAKF